MSRRLIWTLPVLLAACASVGSATTPSPTQTLLPHGTVRSTDTATPIGNVAPLETQGPTPTPLTHVIAEGDTLLSIAIDYGVDLADLLLANPGVNPRLLSIGQALTIPRSGAQGPVPSATPLPIQLSPVSCYATAREGLVCLLTATTDTDPSLEGIVALITLVDAAGAPVLTEAAFGPINVLLPGTQLPLSARFEPPVPAFESASATVISALQATELDSRYAGVDLMLDETQIASDARSAAVSGTVKIMDLETESTLTPRVVVIGLSEDGRLAGYRAWEPPEAGEVFGFDLTVSSLGPAIETVQVLAEATRLQ